MPRARCPSCGATVDIARVKDTNRTVALDIHPAVSDEAPRYRVVRQRPLLVLPVTKDARGDFLPDHSFDCSGANAGRR